MSLQLFSVQVDFLAEIVPVQGKADCTRLMFTFMNGFPPPTSLTTGSNPAGVETKSALASAEEENNLWKSPV
jgi:hypothetical protein